MLLDLLDVVLVLLWFFACLFVRLFVYRLVTEGSKKAGGSCFWNCNTNVSLGGFQRNETVLIHLKNSLPSNILS